MRLLLPLALACAFALLPATAQARSGSCLIPGSEAKCSIWTGRVTHMVDGDTVWVDIAHSSRVVKVRFTGINAMEQTVYTDSASTRRGYCHAVEATNRLESLIRRSGWRVRLAAVDASSASHKRWRREVAVKIGGRWRDTGRILLSAGLAVWLPNGNEWLWNKSYSTLAQRAAAAGRGIWNPTSCGRGPEDWARLQLLLNGDADGVDGENLNGEWVRIRNLDPSRTVHLGGWTLRDSLPGGWRFPDWVAVPPGEEMTVHSGRGSATFTELFMGRKGPLFDNAVGGHDSGDTALLLDPQGDVRAWTTYPCRLSCADPNAGALKVSVDGLGSEAVTVTNVGGAPVDLDGYRVWRDPHVYAFGHATVLAPGAQLKLHVVGDPDEDGPLVKYWGKPGPIFNDRGDAVRLTNLRGVQLDCYAYGAATC